MSKAMSNSSPIIALSMIGQIHLLYEFFNEVFVPGEVYHEIVKSNSLRRHGKQELEEVIHEGKIKIYQVENHRLVNRLYGKLHKGELEVIIGAKELVVEYVLIDEKSGRHLAEDFMLTSIGTIGLLVAAKRENKIPEMRCYLDQLNSYHFRISKTLYKQVLKDVGEI